MLMQLIKKSQKFIENLMPIKKDIRALVIDDGSHKKNDVINTFNILNQYISRNGFYVIEDGFTQMLLKESNNALDGVSHILENENKFKLYDQFDEFIFFSAYKGILTKYKN